VAEDAWKGKVASYAELRQVITTYREGEKCGDIFSTTHTQSNANLKASSEYQSNTDWAARYLHNAVAMGAFVLAAQLGVDYLKDPMNAEEFRSGTFVAIMGTIFRFDGQMRTLFTNVFDMSNGYAAVQKMSSLLNQNTRRKALLATKIRRMKRMKAHMEKDPTFALENITLSGVVTEYAGGEGMPQMRVGGTGGISMTFLPGNIISVTAGHSKGKNTFLKLIARILLPTEGFIWYPANLRTRFVGDKPMIFNRNLMFNLQFGNQKPHKEEDIWALCQKLGLSENLIGKGDLELGISGEKISLSNRIIVCIARALLSSVDILLLSNTLDSLNEAMAHRLLKALKELVEEKGMPCLPRDMEVPKPLRKKKTVLYITNNSNIEKFAAVTLQLPEDFVQARAEGVSTVNSLPRQEMPALSDFKNDHGRAQPLFPQVVGTSPSDERACGISCFSPV